MLVMRSQKVVSQADNAVWPRNVRDPGALELS